MAWANELEQGSFRGVGFGVLQTSDTIERRVVDAEIPYRNGGEQDDLGRRPRPTTIRAVLRGDDYLVQLGALQLAVDDARAGTFVHPLLGTWQARCVRVQIEHESSRRNECEVTLELREDGLDVDLPELFSVAAAAKALEMRFDAVELTLSNLPLSSDRVASAVRNARNFADDLEAASTDLTARFEELRSEADAAIREVEAAIDDATSFELVTEIRRMVLEAKRIKDRSERLLPRLVNRTVPVATSLVSLTHHLYGDSAYAEAIEGLNRLTNPFALPAGSRIRVVVA